MRLAALLVGAMLINFGLYLLMDRMVARDRTRIVDALEAQAVEFVRTPLEEQTRRKDRRRPPPPKPQEIKRPRAEVENIANRAAALPSDLEAYAVTSLLGEGGGIALGQRLVEGSGDVMATMMASDLTPITLLPPQYPLSARQRDIEGWVDLVFIVTEQGTVRDPEVVAAEPEGVFDRAARDAVLRWRFRPLLRGGEAVPARVSVRLDFTLDDA